MLKIDSKMNDSCRLCNHYGFCQVYWGYACKRQGGTRTPRLTSKLRRKEVAVNRPLLVQNNQIKQPVLKTFEPIRTKRMNWAL